MSKRVFLSICLGFFAHGACPLELLSQEAQGLEEPIVFKIRNPFFDQPVWRLWTRNPKPVEYSSPVRHDQPKKLKTQQFAPPPAEKRLYPDFSDRGSGPARLPKLRTFEEPPADAAGFWDDCYATLDFAHSNIRVHLGDGEDGMFLRDQFIHIRYGMAFHPATRAQLGVNFTSQSFARRGRHIVDDYSSNHVTEKVFFFINCVRATPSHASFNDNDPAGVHDDYDGLYGHSYQSVGQSSSEVYALTKMLATGGCMPRKTKDLLKLHGSYAAALLTLFKNSLPYEDEQGNPVPYTSELRHRVAYSSHGKVSHWHYARSNLVYHGYRDGLHLGAMIDGAHRMELAPPMAILKLVDIAVEKDGKEIVAPRPRDARIQSVNKTLIRVWGNPGETLRLRIDVRDSYDLQGKELTYTWTRVYPNQKNVSIKQLSEGVYEIACKHDPKLPKGRIPVMLVARNEGDLPSNPVFVNFYWPEEKERSDWRHYGRRRRRDGDEEFVKRQVTINKRPILDVNVSHQTLWSRPGQKARFSYSAKDPEGYPTRFYRWAGDVGQLRDGAFEWDVPEKPEKQVYAVHLIASDATGGFSGKRVKIILAQEPEGLGQDWSATAIGYPSQVGRVRREQDRFHLECRGKGLDLRGDEGVLAFREVEGDFDVLCRVESIKGSSAQAGLSLREGFAEKVRFATVYVDAESPARPRMQGKPKYSPWGSLRARVQKDLAKPIRWIRMVSSNGFVCGYASADGKDWTFAGSMQLQGEKQKFVGPILSGGDGEEGSAKAVLAVDTQGGMDLPMVEVSSKGKQARDGSYPENATVTLRAPGKQAVVYALDPAGFEEAPKSYGEPIQLGPGLHTILARCQDSAQMLRVVVKVRSAKENADN
jgi:hypothetical protein